MSRPPLDSRRRAWILFGAMTLLAFGGPFLVAWVISGGQERQWPPDRLVEWIVLVGVTSCVVILMAACLSLAARERVSARDRSEK